MATPLMGLNLPTVAVTLGPQWASDINSAFSVIDSHNHSSGNGSLIPTAGLNINADLSFASNNATSVKSTRFTSQVSALAGTSDKECVYSVAGALYYNNSSGTAVQITSGTGLNLASVGTIGGDYGGGGVTASVTYNNTSKTYNFLQAASSTAKMAVGDLIVYETATATNAVTIKSPASLAASYNVTLPAAVPASTKFLRMTSAGVLQNDMDTDNSTLEVSGSTIRIKDLGVTTAKLNDLSVTQAKRAALGQQVSASCGSFATGSTSSVDVTNLTVTITTTGRPVMLKLINASSTVASIDMFSTGALTLIASETRILRGGVSIKSQQFRLDGASGNLRMQLPGEVIGTIDTPVAGTYTYKIDTRVTGAGMEIDFNNLTLFAFEL